MKRRIDTEIWEWLEAEEGASGASDFGEAAAEQAFERAVSGLPQSAPGAGFATRVLLRAGVAPSRFSRASRWTLAASLLLVGSLVAFLPAGLRLWSPTWGLADLVTLCGSLATQAGRFAGQAAAIWASVIALAGALQAVVAQPPVVLALAVAALLSIAGFRALHGLLLSPERSARYAHTH